MSAIHSGSGQSGSGQSGSGPSGFGNSAAGQAKAALQGALPQAGRANFGQAAASSMSMKWSALHDAAGVVASLAALPHGQMKPEERNFPAVIRDCGGWRREMAEQGVDDLSVILEAGLAALLAVHARGVDTRPAATALWQEYETARVALLALVPPTSGPGMRRAF